MSNYSHDPKKAADTGLQLRLPVDLVPATQYSRLTNAIPIIEGELRTRDGLTLVGIPMQVNFVNDLFRNSTGDGPVAILADTVQPHGYRVGDSVTINVIAIDPSEASTLTLGAYGVTVTSVPTSSTFGFTSAIPVTYSPGTNLTIKVDAQVTSTALLNTLVNTPIDNLFRLNQAIPTLTGDRIATMNGRIFLAQLPNGNVFTELAGERAPGAPSPQNFRMGFSGRPISIAEFRFTLDTASWAIFADQNTMWKYRPGQAEPALEMAPLGNAPPGLPASYSAGGAGNLNSTGGTGYDWRYTYVDGYALTESNPSPINMSTGGTSTTHPTAETNPAFTGQNTFTSVSTTGGTGAASVSSYTSSTPGVSQASCLWKSWAPAAGILTKTTLIITVNVTGNASYSVPNNQASASFSVSYSYDGGTSFNFLTGYTVSAGPSGPSSNSLNTGSQTFAVNIPTSASLTNIQVLVLASANANGANANSAQASITGTVSNIGTTITQSGSTNALALTNQIGVVCVNPSIHPQHKFINLYRRGGSLPDAWRLVGQFQVSSLVQGTCGAGTLEIDDNVSDTTLSTAALLQLDNDQPVTSVTITNQPLSFIWGPVGLDARLLGCGDPARPESVYFSKPGNADAWPPQNFVEVSAPGTPIIAGCVFNTRTFAFSRESIYELVEGLGTGATYTPFRTPSAHGLYSPWALAIGPSMYFVAKDGIYETNGGIDQSIVENDIKPLFPTYDTPGQSVHGYEAVDMSQPDNMRLRYHNNELYFCYVGADTGTRQMLIYDIYKKRWRGATYSNGISEVYSEPATTSSLLLGTTGGAVYEAGGSFDPATLDIIENISIGQGTATPTLAFGTYYVRVVRYSPAGASAISYEVSTVVDAIHGIQVILPEGTPSTINWNVFFGTTPGGENQFQSFSESTLPTNRTVVVSAPGTAGTVPTINANNTIHVIIRTGAHDQGAPLNQKQYGNVIFDIDPGGATGSSPVTITPYINGEAQVSAALTITGSGRQQVPLDLSDFFAFNTEYEIAWDGSPL